MSAPKEILDLVARFELHRESYTSGQYNETQLRREFIDPFFKCLGWDVENAAGLAEAYKDVIHEDAIKIGGFLKAPDYCFRIGGARKIFIEAKKPSINLKDDISPAFQLRRYAWSGKLPLSILTDFEELAVYDCRIKPVKTDKASTARTLYVTANEYASRWDEIASVFSKEAVLKGSFDKYAETTALKKGTAEVDDVLLTEIESWRDALARNIALRNEQLTQRELNFAVQRTIDRIIFLRICEDRGIESYGQLQALQNGPDVYRRLCEIYHRADERYNSGLFHFRVERDVAEQPDELTLGLAIDDAVLKAVIKALYYPDSPYEFSVLPASILGQVYEQFLGKVIRLTAGHRAVVEEKPEVKKAGGVYYTPSFIVDYIVMRTVGSLLEGKTPKQISGTPGKAAPLRILDPACGSGSFLIGAYQYLLDWHRDWYITDGTEKWTKGKSPQLYQGPSGDWRLTTAERKRILLNHIYGIDIDSQAVEVTKLSLLLKVLEGENEQTLSSQVLLFHERALPSLARNIKCGNSLVGPDFYEAQQMDLLDESERYRINVFDWRTEFPEVFGGAEPGFDAVIGNPPYVRQELLGEFKPYFQKHYETYHGVADLYVYFIEKGVSLLRNGGIFGIIVANKWMRANYGMPLRQWLKQQHIAEITDFGDLPVFQKATTYPCILRIEKSAPEAAFGAAHVDSLKNLDLGSFVEEHSFRISYTGLDDKGWSLAGDETQALLEKLKKKGRPLSEYVGGRIFRGVLTGFNEAFVIDTATRDRLISEDARSAELIKPFLAGRDIKRYEPPISDKYLILIPKGWTNERVAAKAEAWKWIKDNYPAIAAHLEPFSEKAQKRCDKGDYWWELRACDYYEQFEKTKIIIPAIVKAASYAIDSTGLYSNDKTSIIATDDLYLLGLLNSRLLDFIIHSISSTKRGGYFEYKPMYVSQLPIRGTSTDDAKDVALRDQVIGHVKQMLSLQRQLSKAKVANDRTALKRQIDATDKQIDHLIYELYDLTAEEIDLIEKP
jgi:predicted type IV restriction endonuclease